MNKLTAEKCRDRISELQLAKTFGGISLKEQDYFEALEIALPVLERQGEIDKPIECPFPCGWKELLRIAMNNGAFLAQNLIEGEEVKDIHRHAAFNNTDYLVSVISAILKNQPQPSTTPQIDNDDWIEWDGGKSELGSNHVVVRFRDGSGYEGPADTLWWRHHGHKNDIIAYRVVENDGDEA